MSKSSRSKRGRDVSSAASAHRYRPRPVPRVSASMSVLPQLSRTNDPFGVLALPVADRRTWHPAGPLTRPWAAPFSSSRQVAKQNPSFNQPSYTKAVVAFQAPDGVAVCVRRKRRKQVLHAKGVAGKKGIRRYRRNYTSNYSCR